MAVAVGRTVYSLGTSPCSGLGVSWTDNELDHAMTNGVAAGVFDDAGSAEVEALLSSVADTNFDSQVLEKMLQPPNSIENWRVGEALAETYLSDHRQCRFPWPDGRDERRSGSSLPGADLVGFSVDVSGSRFAFGEVKTSSEEKRPPQLLTGRTGLHRQIEDLRDNEKVRNDLVKYLAHRARTAEWRQEFEISARRYLNCTCDVHLFGVLVRDVSPHEDDLRVRVQKLGKNVPNPTVIELITVYLPTNSIDQLGSKAIAASGAA